MVLLFIVTPAHYFLSHRVSLASAAAAAGWDVHVATPPGADAERIRGLGFTTHPIGLSRAIASPVRELRDFVAVVRLCRRLRPALVHAISPKGAVFGGLAARMTGTSAVIMKGGLGTTAVEGGILNAIARRVIRYGIRAGVSSRATLVVQNDHERVDLAGSRNASTRTTLVQGSGVDCVRFAPRPEPPSPIQIVLPARMLHSKGVGEFVEAARVIAARGIRARFVLAGATDPGNTTGVSERQLRQWNDEGIVDWLGHCDDMPGLLARSHIVCLPSRGEGLPRALTEAAAAGLPIVTCDVPGCRDVVQHGVNGLLVPPRDARALADALQTLIANAQMRADFGAAGRAAALRRFDERIIIPRMLSIYGSLVAERSAA